MRDPESVRIRDVRANPRTGAVCGYYNAKNAYGGYVGEQMFVYYHDADHPEPQVLFGANIQAAVIRSFGTQCPGRL